MPPATTPIRCAACRIRIRVPLEMIGRRVKCPKCEAIFIASAGESPPENAAGHASLSPSQIVVHCSACSATVKLPAGSADRKFRCPRCRAPLVFDASAGAAEHQVSTPTAPSTEQPAENEFDGVLKLAPIESSPEQNLPPSTVIKPLAQGPDQACPSCGKRYAGDARLCTNCGIYLKTGRGILTTQDENLDQVYIYAESLLRYLSFLIFLGVYPIASEAFGLRKPWVVRSIALLTVLVGAFQLYSCIADSPAQASINQMMLWGGDATRIDDLRARLKREIRDERPLAPAASEDLDAKIDALLEDAISTFSPYQLVTHAFLHGDLLHLASNMLFLMVLGARVNSLIGNLWTLALYPVLAIFAGIAHLVAVAQGPPSAMLGASGAVMGLAGMYLVLFPVHQVHMAAWLRWGILLPLRFSLKMFSVRGFWVVLFYIAFDVAYTILRIEDGVAHWAHLGGFAAGAVIAMLLLVCRLIDARGGDLFSALLGRHAWKLIGRPRSAATGAAGKA